MALGVEIHILWKVGYGRADVATALLPTAERSLKTLVLQHLDFLSSWRVIYTLLQIGGGTKIKPKNGVKSFL